MTKPSIDDFIDVENQLIFERHVAFAFGDWNIFENDRLFGSIALTGAVTRPLANDPTNRLYGPMISLHSTFELGYAFDPRSSLSFDFDHANPAPVLGDRNVPGENLRLQYGFHF